MLTHLAQALAARRELSEWVARERQSETAWVSNGGEGAATHTTGHGAVFVDATAGRGAALLELGHSDLARLPERIERAAERARAAAGPSWRLPLPAAPARVELDDPALGPDAATELADELRAAAAAAGAELRRWDVHVARDTIGVRTSAGLHASYTATAARVTAAATTASGAVVRIDLHRRRRAELELANELQRAGRRASDRTAARRLPAGRYSMRMPPDVIEHTACPQHPHGVWQPLVAQADGARARRGLSRYLRDHAIAREPARDALTLTSDGTLPFAALSAPFGAWGEPVRRFALVRRGRAAGVALDAREAALRGVTPNGGTRNLVLAPGSGSDDPDAVELAELGWWETDPASGSFTAELTLGYWRGTPVHAAVLRGNLFDALGDAAFGGEARATSWYVGPEVHFASVEVV